MLHLFHRTFGNCGKDLTLEMSCESGQFPQQNIITTAFCRGNWIHRCNICSFRNENHAQVMRHIQTQHARQICSKSNTSNRGNETTDMYECDVCGFQTLYQLSFKRHRLRHSNVGPFQCLHCNYSSTTLSSLRRHDNETHAKHLKRYSTSISQPADFEPSRPLHFGNRGAQAFRTGTGVFPCLHCKYSSTRKFNLEKHVKKVHDISAKPYKCAKCKAGYVSKTGLVIHLRSKHGESPSAHQSSVGNTASPRRSSASLSHQIRSNRRTLAVHASAERSSSVDTAHVAAVTSRGPAISVRRTRGRELGRGRACVLPIRNHQCVFCPFKTRYLHILEQHVKTAHGRDIRLFKCTLCGYRTNLRCNMFRHLKCVHHSVTSGDFVALSVKQAMDTIKDYMSRAGRRFSSVQHSDLKYQRNVAKPKLRRAARMITNKQAEDISDTLTPAAQCLSNLITNPRRTGGIDDVVTDIDSKSDRLTAGIKVLSAEGGVDSLSQSNSIVGTGTIRGSEVVQVLECTICPRTFPTVAALCQHVITHKDLRRYRCLTCGWRSNRKEHMQEHVNRIHENGVSFDRLSVGEAVETIKHYKQQLPLLRSKGVQAKEPRLFAVMQSGSNLDINSLSVSDCPASNEFKSLFVCKVCSLRFAKEESLRRHVVTHVGVRRYQCLLCGLRTHFERRVKNHVASVHGVVVASAFYCQLFADGATDTTGHCRLDLPVRVGSSTKFFNSGESVDKQCGMLTKVFAGGVDVTRDEAGTADIGSLAFVPFQNEPKESSKRLFANNRTSPSDELTSERHDTKTSSVCSYYPRRMIPFRKLGQNISLLRCGLCSFSTRRQIVLRRHKRICHSSGEEAGSSLIAGGFHCNEVATSLHIDQRDAENEDLQLCESEFYSSSIELPGTEPRDLIAMQAESTVTTSSIGSTVNFESESRPLGGVDRLKLRRFVCLVCGYRSNLRIDLIKHQKRAHPGGLDTVNILPEDEARKTLMLYETTHGRRGRPIRNMYAVVSDICESRDQSCPRSDKVPEGPEIDGLKSVIPHAMSTNQLGNDVDFAEGKYSDGRRGSSLQSVRRFYLSSALKCAAEVQVYNNNSNNKKKTKNDVKTGDTRGINSDVTLTNFRRGRLSFDIKTSSAWYRQQQYDSLADLRRFKCSKCDYRSSWRSSVFKHIKTRHAGARIVQLTVGEAKAAKNGGMNSARRCAIQSHNCSYRASSSVDLTQHTRLLHRSNADRTQVRVTESGISLPSTSQSRVSTNVPPCKCSLCTFRSRWSRGRSDHPRHVHKRAKNNSPSARGAEATSGSVDAARTSASSNPVEVPSRLRSSLCNRRVHHVGSCGENAQLNSRSFRSQWDFRTTRSHSGTRNRSDSEKVMRGTGTRHMSLMPSRSRTTSGVPRFKCSLCGFGSYWYGSVYNHQRRFHRNARVSQLSVADAATARKRRENRKKNHPRSSQQPLLNSRSSRVEVNTATSAALKFYPKKSGLSFAAPKQSVNRRHQRNSDPANDGTVTVLPKEKNDSERTDDPTPISGKRRKTTTDLPVKIPSVEQTVGARSVLCLPNAKTVDSLSPVCRSDDMIRSDSIARDLENDGSPTAELDTEESDASRSRVITHSTTRRAAFRNTWLMCKQCPFLTKLSYSLLAHKQLHRSRASATVRCSLCSYSCGSREKLAKHSVVHERNYIERRTLKQWCSVPAKTQFPAGAFFSSSVLACGLCPFLTIHSFALYRHKQQHLPRPTAIFRCSICSFRSCDRKTSVEHDRVHEFMYLKKRLNTLCHFTTAQATSSSRRNLGDRVSHSESSGEVAMSSVGEMTVRKELKTWRCGRCPYVVEDVEHFRRHVSMHGRRRPHECVECNFSTFSYWQSAEHRRLHITGVHSQSLVNLTQRSQVLADDEQPCVTKDDSYVEGQSRTTKIEAWRCDRDCYDERCALSDDEAMRRMDCREEAKRLLRHERGISREECKCCRCCVTYEPQQRTISQVKAEDDDDSSGSRSNMKSAISDERGVEKGQYDCVLTCSSLESETTLQCDKSSVQTESETVSYNCHCAKSTVDPAEEALNSDEPFTIARFKEVHISDPGLTGVRNESGKLLAEHEASYVTEEPR
jgi:hypothetical protein